MQVKKHAWQQACSADTKRDSQFRLDTINSSNVGKQLIITVMFITKCHFEKIKQKIRLLRLPIQLLLSHTDNNNTILAHSKHCAVHCTFQTVTNYITQRSKNSTSTFPCIELLGTICQIYGPIIIVQHQTIYKNIYTKT